MWRDRSAPEGERVGLMDAWYDTAPGLHPRGRVRNRREVRVTVTRPHLFRAVS